MFDRCQAGPAPLRRVAGVLATLVLLAGCSPRTSVSDQPSPPATPVKLVVLGDSIPYNSDDDCPGCTGFVDRYATALSERLGRPVQTSNLSEHTGLTLPGLLSELPSFESAIAEADVIVVGIAHNSFLLNDDKPCGATFNETTYTMSDWTKIDARCAKEAAVRYRSQFDRLYARIAAIRAGKPTVLRTINRYNDWTGWPEARLTQDQVHRIVVALDAWNAVLCGSAEAHAFTCVDVNAALNGPDRTKPAGDRLAADYLHPSDRGNEVIAEALVATGVAPLA